MDGVAFDYVGLINCEMRLLAHVFGHVSVSGLGRGGE